MDEDRFNLALRGFLKPNFDTLGVGTNANPAEIPTFAVARSQNTASPGSRSASATCSDAGQAAGASSVPATLRVP
jgi:hypothetical protein